MMKVVAVAVTLFLFAIVLVKATELGCPDDVSPCTCLSESSGHHVILICRNILSSELLGNVFTKSKNYAYKEVVLSNSTLQYIPKSIFEDVEIYRMGLTDVTISQVFDKPQKQNTLLHTLELVKTKVLRGLAWKELAPLTGLLFLKIQNSPVKAITTDMSNYVTHGLQILSLSNINVKRIQSGAFQDYTKLQHLDVSGGQVTELTRDMFPHPTWSSIEIFYFQHLKLQSIPTDLFTGMPNLRIIGLEGNQLATLLESALGENPKLETFIIDENPLKCDCDLRWIIRRNIRALVGKCSSPKALHDKELKDLSESDFHCAK